jgi:hypothetical protein
MASVIYDLPFGKGRQLPTIPGSRWIGWWAAGPSSLVRYSSGFPYMAYLSDTNQLGDYTHARAPGHQSGRADAQSAVQPQLPNGHRLPAVRESGSIHASRAGRSGQRAAHAGWRPRPVAAFFDANIQKNFRSVRSGAALQFRMDALNVLNHPVFAVYPN